MEIPPEKDKEDKKGFADIRLAKARSEVQAGEQDEAAGILLARGGKRGLLSALAALRLRLAGKTGPEARVLQFAVDAVLKPALFFSGKGGKASASPAAAAVAAAAVSAAVGYRALQAPSPVQTAPAAQVQTAPGQSIFYTDAVPGSAVRASAVKPAAAGSGPASGTAASFSGPAGAAPTAIELPRLGGLFAAAGAALLEPKSASAAPMMPSIHLSAASFPKNLPPPPSWSWPQADPAAGQIASSGAETAADEAGEAPADGKRKGNKSKEGAKAKGKAQGLAKRALGGSGAIDLTISARGNRSYRGLSAALRQLQGMQGISTALTQSSDGGESSVNTAMAQFEGSFAQSDLNLVSTLAGGKDGGAMGGAAASFQANIISGGGILAGAGLYAPLLDPVEDGNGAPVLDANMEAAMTKVKDQTVWRCDFDEAMVKLIEAATINAEIKSAVAPCRQANIPLMTCIGNALGIAFKANVRLPQLGAEIRAIGDRLDKTVGWGVGTGDSGVPEVLKKLGAAVEGSKDCAINGCPDPEGRGMVDGSKWLEYKICYESGMTRQMADTALSGSFTPDLCKQAYQQWAQGRYVTVNSQGQIISNPTTPCVPTP